MARIVERLRNQLLEEVFTENEIDNIMAAEHYYPIESDEITEEGILKYSNGKSEMWIRYIHAYGEYLVSGITNKTKKSGSTRTRHLTPEEIKRFMDYFRDNKKYDEFMIFIMELFLARRIGDTLSLEWGHFFYENGSKKKQINDLLEHKTEKIAKLHIPDVVWKYIDWYCRVKKINPLEHYEEDIFTHEAKNGVLKYNASKDEYQPEYKKAIKKQEKSFWYQFNLAAQRLGIEGVSTHSIRKSFGYIAHMLNQYDPDCLDVLQSIYVHDSKETTKIYIDVIDDKAKGMFNGVANYVNDLDNGETPCIQNTPVIALKTNDLRDILLKAYNIGMKNHSVADPEIHMDIMNQLIAEVEQKRV